MRKSQNRASSSARWMIATATLGCITAFAAPQSGSAPTLYAQAKPTVLISAPAGGATYSAPTAIGGAANCSSVNSGLIQASKSMPAEVALGDTFTYTISVTPVACVGNVVVTETIPPGASIVSTEPQGSTSGNTITWNLGDLDAGQAKVIKVTAKADKEGTLASCATIKADPRVCAKTIVGRPQLAIEKSGPAEAELGKDIAYSIVVKNIGTSVAKGVVVTDKVPAGLGGVREVPFTVGDLAPGASKTIPITLKAAERGKFCNVAVATAANAPSVQDDACTEIFRHLLKVTKTGTPEQFIGRQASYTIEVHNQGDRPQTQVVVTDTAPAGTKIVNAPGASINGNTASWTLPTLAAGEKKQFTVVLTTVQQGRLCNTVSAKSAQGLTDTAEACTLWKGVAGILVEFVDDPDPIQVGETSNYTIRVTNQGYIDLTNVSVVAESDTEIDPISSPRGQISGKKVTFPVAAKLAPKESLTYTYVGKGVAAGQAYDKVIVNCDQVKASIEDVEVTNVY